MKKKYLYPKMEVVKLTPTLLQSTSPISGKLNNTEGDGDVLSSGIFSSDSEDW